MSECVVPMKKPGSCRECFDTHRCFGTGEWYTDGTLWCGLAKGYIGDEMTKCPVIELPEGHGRLMDADAMAKDLEYDCELDARGLDDMTIVGHEREHLQFDKDCKQNCMRYLTEQETIVPAEAERSEDA